MNKTTQQMTAFSEMMAAPHLNIFFVNSQKDNGQIIDAFRTLLSNFGPHTFNEVPDAGVLGNVVKYAIIIISPNFVADPVCLNNFSLLKNLYIENKVCLFPVCLGGDLELASPELENFLLSGCSRIDSFEDIPRCVMYILTKIIEDELAPLKYNSVEDLELYFENKNCMYYKLLSKYGDIKKTDFDMRIAFLFALHLTLAYDSPQTYFHQKTMNFIYHLKCLGAPFEEDMATRTMENIVICEFPDNLIETDTSQTRSINYF